MSEPQPTERSTQAPDGSDPLVRAAERVIRHHATDPPVSPNEELLRLEITEVAESVRGALDGRSGKALGTGQLDRLHLLLLLRTAVVRAWSEGDGPLLPLMRAFETVQASLMRSREDASVTQVLAPFSRSLLREVAHLLRSPLGSIVMLTDTLREGASGPLTDLQKRQLDIIYRAALAVGATAGELLALTTETEGIERSSRFRVGDVVQSVADVVRPVTEARGCRLLVQEMVETHRTGPALALGQALLWLTLRAAVRTRHGTVELHATPEHGDVVAFLVRADGAEEEVGVSSADPFRLFLVDPDTGSYTLCPDGLGVSAARAILRALASELQVRRGNAGELSMSFRVTLPAAD